MIFRKSIYCTTYYNTYLLNRSRRTHTIELYRSYDTLPLPLLHNYQILLFVHKFMHHSNKLPSVFASYFTQNQLIHHYNTREKFNLHLVTPHISFGKRLIKYKGSQMWNSLDQTLRTIQSTNAFKSSLRIILITNQK